jgi:hypothetical protein
VGDERFAAVKADEAKAATLAAFANLFGVEAVRLCVEELGEPTDRGALARAGDSGEEQVPLQSTVMPSFLMSGTQNA